MFPDDFKVVNEIYNIKLKIYINTSNIVKLFLIVFLFCNTVFAQTYPLSNFSGALDSAVVLLEDRFNDYNVDTIYEYKNYVVKQIMGLGRTKIINGKAVLKSKYSEDKKHIGYCRLMSNDKINRLILIDSLFFVKTVSHSDSVFIGGVKFFNLYGKFYIYSFENDIVKEIFESEEYVYNYSLDCNSYNRKGFLKFKNKDLNKDGFLDINFKGIRYRHCSLMETGFNRLNRKIPNRKYKLNLRYMYEPLNAKWKKEKSNQ